MTKAQQAEREQAKEQLRKWLAPGDTVYCILRHVSRSGMQREIGTVLMQCDAKERRATDLHPNYLIATALGWRQGKRDGIIVDGCGMDMGFHLVYTMSHALFPGGFCPSPLARREASHGDKLVDLSAFCGKGVEPLTRREVTILYGEGWRFTGGRNGDDTGWDTNGGYALKHRWL